MKYSESDIDKSLQTSGIVYPKKSVPIVPDAQGYSRTKPHQRPFNSVLSSPLVVETHPSMITVNSLNPHLPVLQNMSQLLYVNTRDDRWLVQNFPDFVHPAEC